MPDDLQEQEELFLRALEEYKENPRKEPTQESRYNPIPAVIAGTL